MLCYGMVWYVCMYTHVHMNQSTFDTLGSNLNYRELAAVRITRRDATILPINNTFFFVVINYFW